MVPRLVPEGDLLTANAVSGQVADVSRLAGSALGGVLVAGRRHHRGDPGRRGQFPGLSRPAGPGADNRTEAAREGGPVWDRLGQVGADLGGGLRLATGHRTLRLLMIFALVTSVGEGIMSTLFTPFVEHVLHGSPQDLGFILAAQAVGGIAGGMAAAAAGHRIRAARLLGGGAVVFGLVNRAIFLYPLGYVAVWPAIAGMILVGLPGALTLAGLITLFQRSSEDSYRGRVFGALSALEGISVLAGTLGAGYLSRLAGIVPVLAIQGAGVRRGGPGHAPLPEGRGRGG